LIARLSSHSCPRKKQKERIELIEKSEGFIKDEISAAGTAAQVSPRLADGWPGE
jgi:hypothetical protein